MTLPRTLPFEHVGGPADGGTVEVPVDENDVPVEMHILSDFTGTDITVNPAAALSAMPLRATYYRAVNENGDYVFKFLGQDVLDDHRAA